ncbi:MAG: diguanylate cyclase [Polyangiales bacterium]
MTESSATTASILIVDDDPIMIRLLSKMLASLGQLRFATDGETALALMRASAPDVVLLDAEMPGLSGTSLCSMIKREPDLADIPVIFVTSHHEPEFEVRCFEAGAVDFVQKPVHAPVLLARLQTHLRLKQLSDRLRRSARLDPLTEVANRRVFDEMLEYEWRRALRTHQPLSLLLIDIDHFKAFNDFYGHPAGDDCLRRFADKLRRVVHRATDLVARYGGEEFAVLLPETHSEGAQAVAARLLQLLYEQPIPHARSSTSDRVTASVGFSTFAPQGSSSKRRSEPPMAAGSTGASELLGLADAALYESKNAGRSRISFRPFHREEHVA